MRQYGGTAAAQIDLQRLNIQRLNAPVNRQPESIIAYLRSLRRYLDAKEAAKLIGCHLESLYILISKGLPAEKRGRRWRIDPIRLAAWLEQQ